MAVKMEGELKLLLHCQMACSGDTFWSSYTWNWCNLQIVSGSITLLSTGPLTNIAVALMLDASFGSKLKDCVMMGGNYVGELDLACYNFLLS